MPLPLIFYDEYWDETKEEFVRKNVRTIILEHSLVSISKWEAQYKVPFLSKTDKTPQEINDYIRFMTLTQNVNPELYNQLTPHHYKEIQDYINDPMTATWFSEDKKGKRGREQVTSELIYYWMIAHNIPFECKKWHLNRLLTLIKICNIKSQPAKKMSKRDSIAERVALNAARRKRLGTKG